jgi:hypothetical protein
MKSYQKIYNTEDYLFKEVHEKFQKAGYLVGLDFYLILIWKTNRAKFKNAQKIKKKYPGKTFEENVKILINDIYNAKSPIDNIIIIILLL